LRDPPAGVDDPLERRARHARIAPAQRIGAGLREQMRIEKEAAAMNERIE
jgi:hypothetical protein